MKKKQIQKRKKQERQMYTSSNSDNTVTRILIILVGILVVLGLVYFVAKIMTGEIKFGGKKDNDNTEVSIQYDEILGGETFLKADETYFVLFMNFTNAYTPVLMMDADSYISKEEGDHFPVYYVDMEKNFNQYYRAGEEGSNSSASSASELRVIAPTLVKISNHKIVEYIEGYEQIDAYFTNLNT